MAFQLNSGPCEGYPRIVLVDPSMPSVVDMLSGSPELAGTAGRSAELTSIVAIVE